MAKGTKAAARAAGWAPSGERGIFRRLKEEHAQVARMMSRVAAMRDVGEKRRLFETVRVELLAHAKGEQAELYPVFREVEETEEIVEEALDDHEAIEQMLETLRSMDVDSEEWDELFDEVMSEVEDHVAQEENELFSLAEELIDAEHADKIEEHYVSSKERAMRQVA